MKKTILAILLIVIVSVILLIITSIPSVNRKMIFIGEYNVEINAELGQIISNYDEYEKLFNSSSLEYKNFLRHNYVIVPIRYNSCYEYDINPKIDSIDGNNIKIVVEYKEGCTYFCRAYKVQYYLLELKKETTNVNINIDYVKVEDENRCVYPPEPGYYDLDKVTVDKPMIYLYPESKTDVRIKFGYPEKLTTTYPKYKSSWDIIAYPNGVLVDKNTDRELYGLYWEGIGYDAKMTNEGFVVKSEDVASFLERKLEVLGLNSRETEEFIVYWLPILEKNKFNYIRFDTNEEIDKYMPLEISPNPDSVIRVVMVFKGLDKKIEVEEQKLATPERNGFTVIEWGGSKIAD